MATLRSGSSLSVNEVLIGHRTYLSTQHLWMTEHCAQFAETYEARRREEKPAFHIHLRGHVLAAITESVAFLEALVNELLEDCHGEHPGHIEVLNEELRRKLGEYWRISGGNDSILSKYETVRNLAGQSGYDRGGDPYQSANLLVKLRNWQVHFKPTTIWGSEPHSLQKQLQGRFTESPLMSGTGNPWFPDKALGGSCARWCLTTVRAFADDFVTSLSYTPNYVMVNNPRDEPAVQESDGGADVGPPSLGP